MQRKIVGERSDLEQDQSKEEGDEKKEEHRAYSKGDINRLIDGLMHPLAEKDKSFILLDGLLHALNEREPSKSLRKFVRFNLPEIIKRIDESSHDRA